MPLQWPEPEQCRRLAPGPGVFQLGVSVEPLGAALHLGVSVVRLGMAPAGRVCCAPVVERPAGWCNAAGASDAVLSTLSPRAKHSDCVCLQVLTGTDA
jgi:hypothetical protein